MQKTSLTFFFFLFSHPITNWWLLPRLEQSRKGSKLLLQSLLTGKHKSKHPQTSMEQRIPSGKISLTAYLIWVRFLFCGWSSKARVCVYSFCGNFRIQIPSQLNLTSRVN